MGKDMTAAGRAARKKKMHDRKFTSPPIVTIAQQFSVVAEDDRADVVDRVDKFRIALFSLLLTGDANASGEQRVRPEVEALMRAHGLRVGPGALRFGLHNVHHVRQNHSAARMRP